MKEYPAVILSGGKSQRMGSPKLLLAQEGELLVERMLGKLKATGWDPVGVVVSDQVLADFVKKRMPGLETIFNRAPEHGMISSIRLGLDWAGDDAEGLLTLPVDHPLITSETLSSIKAAVTRDCVVVPVYNGRRGHPTWWGRSCWNALYSETADAGAMMVLRQSRSCGMNVVELEVEDAFVLVNINTVEDMNKYQLEGYSVEDFD
ncbi:nucleotidyltransferase family protein [bacterium]|nr:nucleotidyltransferase family protein [bacterium]